MISLIDYDEFGPNMGYKSMRDFFEVAPYEGQKKIASYLDNGTPTYVRMYRGKDFLQENLYQALIQV